MTTRAMTFVDHLRELRYRLLTSTLAALFCSLVVFILYGPLLKLLTFPLSNMHSSIDSHLFFINTLFEGFTTKFKFAFIGGMVLSFPVHIFNSLRFIFPALEKRGKRLVALILFISLLLACGSLYLSYHHILPISVAFLTDHHFIPAEVGVLLNYKSNVFYVFNFLIMSMILFQFPIVLELLLYLNILSRKGVFKASRYIITGIFVLTAIVTPPDIVSQVTLALPLIILFFITLLIAKLCKFGEG